jgi:5'-nucleotidase
MDSGSNAVIDTTDTYPEATVLDRILITNDDGIDAPGLAVMEAIATELAREVWVVAPEHDQSGVSHAVSLHHPLRTSNQGVRRFGVDGTPGDCAVLGVCHLMPERPDLILSGVNRGGNLGMETVFSGTVGGAMTGMLLGIPSIALSQCWSDRNNIPWDTARTLGAAAIRQLLEIGWSPDTCLNVNFPDCAPGAAGPLTLARQGLGLVQGMTVETRTDPRGMEYHWINFRRGPRPQGPESDSDTTRAGRIAVTPVRFDRTDEAAYAVLSAKLPRLQV